jgi:hypothetical protein
MVTKDISLAAQTMFAELLHRSLDAEFDERYDERGSFIRRRRRNLLYWYYKRFEDGLRHEEYVGPVRDPAINERVKRFEQIKSDFKQRWEMVRSLAAARLPTPDKLTGDVIEAMWRAGFFRLRGVLVGTAGYQGYAGLLGVRLESATLMTQDADFAQFWGISQAIGETMPPMIDVLKAVDETFREIPSLNDPFVTTRYRNSRGYDVEFLTPNRGSDEHQGQPTQMPALGGASAQPMRHLDFLIHEPERTVLLHNGGVPVTVPRAERYAVHKLIVAVERDDQIKSTKDIMQAGSLIRALAERRPIELARAWDDAWNAGPRWREKLSIGFERLSEADRQLLEDVRARAEAMKQRKRRKPR